MDKKIYKAVSERADGYCELCFRWGGESLHLHHIVGGKGKRQTCENEESCMMLCRECHDAVHSNDKLVKALRKYVQEKYKNKGYSEDEIREKMGGKIY